MKILFSGPQCSGKTTLIMKMEQDPRYRDRFRFIPSASRTLHSQGVKVNREGDDVTQIRLIAEDLINFLYDDCVYDRGVLDRMAFATDQYHSKRICFDTFRITDMLFQEVIYRYDVIFFTCPDFEPVENGVRDIDPEYRERISQIYDVLIKSFRIPIIRLEGSIEERYVTIQCAIEQFPDLNVNSTQQTERLNG